MYRRRLEQLRKRSNHQYFANNLYTRNTTRNQKQIIVKIYHFGRSLTAGRARKALQARLPREAT